MIRRRSMPRVSSPFLLLCSILLSYSSVASAAVVTLDSIEILKTHEWLPTKPTVYFHCKGEDKIVLPDVKEKRVNYTFRGEESWQPLTHLEDKKCKRCGVYEKDTLKSDDVFDEWEFCASDFNSEGKYIHFKKEEFNATFLCAECVPLVAASNHSPKSETSSSGLHWAVVLVISAVVSTVFITGLVAGYKYWKKRRRQHEQARFLRLFEEGDDDIEDELGIGPLSHVV